MVHQKIRQHICSLCSKAFGKKSGLDRHVITVHEKMRCWVCDLCEKSFGEKAQLFRHRKVHFKPTCLEPDPAQVTEDQEVFENKKTRMRCGICKKVVNSRAALKRHKLLVHEKKRNLLCDFCPKLFGEKSNLKRHIMKSHATEAGLVKVDVVEFSRKKIRYSHPAASETFSCATCDKVLTTNWGLQAHEEVCLINQQKKLNEIQDDHENGEEFADVDRMEEIFLVSSGAAETLDVKQEPPFMDDNASNDSYSKFIPEVSQVEATEPIGVVVKEESLEEGDIAEFIIKLEPDDEAAFDLDIIEECSEVEQSESCNEYHLEPDSELSESAETESDSEVLRKSREETDDESKPAVTFLKRFKCKVCGSTFKEKRYFQSHYRTVHGRKRMLQCNVDGCKESFVYRAQRLRHLRQIHPEFYEDSDQEEYEADKLLLESSVQCELCKVSFESQEELDAHTEEAHEEDENQDDGDESERTCTICDPPRSFKKQYYSLHVQAAHSEKSYACDQCPRTFSFKCSLGRHIKGVHENIRNFKCVEPECDKSFRSSYDLRQHSISAHQKGDRSDRTCSICFKVFKKVKYMQIHQASIHNTEPQFFCPICNRGFSFQRSMDRHVKAIHEDRKDYKCTAEGCEKAFRSRYELNEHFNNIHAEVKKKRPVEQVTCDVCDKVCSSRKVLYSHKKLVHEGVKWGLKFECKLCKENFESKYKKSKHWLTCHRNGQIKMRTCHFCNSDFQLFDEFKLHVESHAGRFICLTCGHDFPDDSSLFMHQETHRKIEEELRQYVCDVCSHRLSTKAQLLIHMRKHFTGDYYMCDVSSEFLREIIAKIIILTQQVCGKSYKFIAPFLHHKMGHENRFDFPCRYCEKKFRVGRDRMLHERIHTKGKPRKSDHDESSIMTFISERPYKCDQCQKSFAHKANYLSHLKTHETKAYVCKHCGLQNSSASKLRHHEDQDHPEVRPYRCCYCRKNFKQVHSLEAHKDRCSVGLGGNRPGSTVVKEFY